MVGLVPEKSKKENTSRSISERGFDSLRRKRGRQPHDHGTMCIVLTRATACISSLAHDNHRVVGDIRARVMWVAQERCRRIVFLLPFFPPYTTGSLYPRIMCWDIYIYISSTPVETTKLTSKSKLRIFLCSCTIDLYIYICIHPFYPNGMRQANRLLFLCLVFLTLYSFYFLRFRCTHVLWISSRLSSTLWGSLNKLTISHFKKGLENVKL